MNAVTVSDQGVVFKVPGAGKLTISFMNGADHTFSARVPRRALVNALVEHLSRPTLECGDPAPL